MSVVRPIALSNLLIDVENPRIETDLENQREAIRAVAAQQDSKLVILAKDIIKHGLNPAEYPIVMQHEDDDERYVVLEGNRRVTALKVLENPNLIEGINDTITRRFKNLSEASDGSPIDILDCVVMNDRTEANHWIELRHTGENEGAGLVRWGGAETARFRERSGKESPALQVLDYLEERGDIDADTRQQVPVSSLKRMLGTPYVRNKLGIDRHSGEVRTRFPDEEVAKGLKHVVEDLASGNIKTKDIYRKDDRIRYVDSLPSEALPDTSNPTEEFRPLGTPAISQEPKSSTPSSKRPRGSSSKKDRLTLIPRSYRLSISTARVNEIYHELRKLEIEQFKNAVSVLFRVFLELSVDAYNSRQQLGISGNDSLSKKLLAVAHDLEDKGKLEHKQVIVVEKAAQKDNFLASSIHTLHQYVHNQYFAPSPSDLRTAWDNLSGFFTAIWS